MARPTTVKGSSIIIELGDGASPEVFAAPCALNTKGINFTGTANEANVPDCDDPDAPLWIERVIATLSGTIAGAGTLAAESYEIWQGWFFSGLERNIRVVVGDLGTYATSAVLTTFNTTGNQGELATIDIEAQSDGEVVWTPTP